MMRGVHYCVSCGAVDGQGALACAHAGQHGAGVMLHNNPAALACLHQRLGAGSPQVS